MGQASSRWQLIILTALIWFFCGLGLALTGGLGAVIGGVGAGVLVEEWGYEPF